MRTCLLNAMLTSLAHRRADRMSQIVEVGRRVLAPFCSLGRWYNETAKRHPVATGVWTSGLKTSAADAFAQKVLEGREELDWKRHATFCTFGFLYLGGFQYWLYNVKFTQWCGPITSRFGHKASAPIKTFIDQAIHHPFMYFPTFYAIKASVAGKPMSYAVDKYKSEIWTSVKTLWTVWVPLQLINFAFVPRHLRVPYVAGVSFGWTMILSVMQGKFDTALEVADSKALSDSVRETVREGGPARLAAFYVTHSGMLSLTLTRPPVPLPAALDPELGKHARTRRRAGQGLVATSLDDSWRHTGCDLTTHNFFRFSHDKALQGSPSRTIEPKKLKHSRASACQAARFQLPW